MKNMLCLWRTNESMKGVKTEILANNMAVVGQLADFLTIWEGQECQKIKDGVVAPYYSAYINELHSDSTLPQIFYSI